jgi:hypothetical protein
LLLGCLPRRVTRIASRFLFRFDKRLLCRLRRDYLWKARRKIVVVATEQSDAILAAQGYDAES